MIHSQNININMSQVQQSSSAPLQPSAASSSVASAPLILRLVYESAKIVNIAGLIVKNVLESGKLAVIDKGVNDFQTKADRVAQRCILQKLYRKFPRVNIIGEEPDGGTVDDDYNELMQASNIDSTVSARFKQILKLKVPDHMLQINEEEVVIWVDPLDGTSEFTKGLLDNVTVLIGIAVGGSPVGGIIHQPFVQDAGCSYGRTFWGIPEVGFGGFQWKSPPKGQRIITTTTRKSNAVRDSSLAGLKPDQIVRIGGSGHKAAFLLDGKGHAYVSPKTEGKKWDICAPEAILKAIGGNLTNIHGQPYQYDKEAQFSNDKGVLATCPGEDHGWYVQRC